MRAKRGAWPRPAPPRSGPPTGRQQAGRQMARDMRGHSLSSSGVCRVAPPPRFPLFHAVSKGQARPCPAATARGRDRPSAALLGHRDRSSVRVRVSAPLWLLGWLLRGVAVCAAGGGPGAYKAGAIAAPQSVPPHAPDRYHLVFVEWMEGGSAIGDARLVVPSRRAAAFLSRSSQGGAGLTFPLGCLSSFRYPLCGSSPASTKAYLV